MNLAVDVDFEKLAGVPDLTFHANMFQIHGGGLSRGALLNFMDVSGIEALPSTRLYESWFERKWGTKLALRAGQLAADTEFMTAKYTEVFTNASLGWPAGLSLNLPSRGPSPPLAAVGARLRADITDNLTLLGAMLTATLQGRARTTRSFATATVSTSASMTRRSRSARCRFSGTARRAIRAWMAS